MATRKKGLSNHVQADDWKRIAAGVFIAAGAYFGHSNGDQLQGIRYDVKQLVSRIERVERNLDFRPNESIARQKEKEGGEN